MDSKKFLTATIAGAVTMFILGFLIYGVLLNSFMRANGAAVMKAEPDFLYLILAQLAWGAFLALVLGQWAGVSTLVGGLRAGAMLGALLGLAIDFELFATMNTMNLHATLVDIVVQAVRFSITGGVVGYILGMGGRR